MSLVYNPQSTQTNKLRASDSLAKYFNRNAESEKCEKAAPSLVRYIGIELCMLICTLVYIYDAVSQVYFCHVEVLPAVESARLWVAE